MRPVGCSEPVVERRRGCGGPSVGGKGGVGVVVGGGGVGGPRTVKEPLNII